MASRYWKVLSELNEMLKEDEQMLIKLRPLKWVDMMITVTKEEKKVTHSFTFKQVRLARFDVIMVEVAEMLKDLRRG